MLPERLTALAVTAPGLAPYASRELRARGIAAGRADVEGVSFHTSLRGVYAANLWLRTASRVLVRLATFHADSFHELERRACRVPWERYATPAVPVRLRVTCRKSRLYHSDAVAERLVSAIERASGAPLASADSAAPASLDEHGSNVNDQLEQLIVVRLVRDQCTISLDSSGPLLHRRGYRQETAKAPLRETLAAGALEAAGWSGQSPLLDPFCGAGTLAIEGAWLARGRAPGLMRDFAFMRWPEFDRASWNELVSAARSEERSSPIASIQASDRDAGAIAAARGNAQRAGVAGDIDIVQRPMSEIEPVPGPGWLVANPPYGVRIGAADQAHGLYEELGRVARRRCAGWTIALLAADAALPRHLGMRLVARLRTVNGGIPVQLLTGVVPEARTPA